MNTKYKLEEIQKSVYVVLMRRTVISVRREVVHTTSIIKRINYKTMLNTLIQKRRCNYTVESYYV